jgi:hypothetical protein
MKPEKTALTKSSSCIELILRVLMKKKRKEKLAFLFKMSIIILQVYHTKLTGFREQLSCRKFLQ